MTLLGTRFWFDLIESTTLATGFPRGNEIPVFIRRHLKSAKVNAFTHFGCEGVGIEYRTTPLIPKLAA